MMMAQNRNKKFFLGGKTTDTHEKKLKTLFCLVLSVNKKFLFFCLQFSFNVRLTYETASITLVFARNNLLFGETYVHLYRFLATIEF